MYIAHRRACQVAQLVKNRQCRRSLFDSWVGKFPWSKDSLHSPVFLPGESPWTEEPGGLQSMRSQRVGHNRATEHNTHAWESKNGKNYNKIKYLMSNIYLQHFIDTISIIIKIIPLCLGLCLVKMDHLDTLFRSGGIWHMSLLTWVLSNAALNSLGAPKSIAISWDSQKQRLGQGFNCKLCIQTCKRMKKESREDLIS